ncbi:MAG: YceH family protein [Acidobacteria bacterium]|nr:YceH family protein [Acidobacteriota bacterium]
MRSVFFGGPAEQQPSPDFVVPELGAEELRVLGCLIEKQFLTPDLYPLTLNSLLNACNQKTSREPVVSYEEETVGQALESLQAKGLATRITGAEHRVPKYRERLSEQTGLRVSETALLAVMMLRGPQTPGELKERTNRIHDFADTVEVEATLDRLMTREPQVLVVKLARQPGLKESRYTHLLGGPVNVEATPAPQPAPPQDRLSRLEAEVAALRERMAHLEQQFEKFRKQFE